MVSWWVCFMIATIAFIAGAVGTAFFCMAADMSSVRPNGEVLDFTPRPK